MNKQLVSLNEFNDAKTKPLIEELSDSNRRIVIARSKATKQSIPQQAAKQSPKFGQRFCIQGDCFALLAMTKLFIELFSNCAIALDPFSCEHYFVNKIGAE